MPRSSATRWASRGPCSPAASRWRAPGGPPTCWRRRRRRRPTSPPRRRVRELRAYQADALAWLGFLDSADLGGCLALDMGLGKTPTLLAHLGRSAGAGPALVVAPPAVVGNWQREAANFTPGLEVLVHHGASRLSGMALDRAVAKADVVITTYGTAVRDVEALEKVSWDRLVLDEAQVIKNPANVPRGSCAGSGPQPHRPHGHADRERPG
ncbi:MAG: SNF2-related protein [Acidimicrobiales bacterium]